MEHQVSVSLFRIPLKIEFYLIPLLLGKGSFSGSIKKEFEDRDNCTEFLTLKADLLAGDKGKDYEEALEKITPIEREEFLYQEFVLKYHAKRISHWI